MKTFFLIKTITKQSPKRFSLFVQHMRQCWVDTRVASVYIIVSFAFVDAMDRIITKFVLLFLHSHFFVLVFDKMKTGPRPTLFSDEPLLN